jgi:hypothetical protein
MANTKKATKKATSVKSEKRALVKMLSVKVLVGFFANQVDDEAALVEGCPTVKQLTRYAKECRKQLKVSLESCSTPKDFAEFSRHLTARLNPNGIDYVNALAY